MKGVDITAKFLEIAVSIPSRAVRQMVEDAIRESFEDTNFWIDQLHLFAAAVEESATGFTITLHVADIADDQGFFSNRMSDDHLKALLLPALASMLEARVRQQFDHEHWLRLARVVNVNRMPRPSGMAPHYGRWLFDLENRPNHVRKQSKAKWHREHSNHQ